MFFGTPYWIRFRIETKADPKNCLIVETFSACVNMWDGFEYAWSCFLKLNFYSAVFTWTNLLVVVAELDGGENEALDLVPLVTNAVLEVSSTPYNHLPL